MQRTDDSITMKIWKFQANVLGQLMQNSFVKILKKYIKISEEFLFAGVMQFIY